MTVWAGVPADRVVAVIAELVSGRDRDLTRIAEAIRDQMRDQMRALAPDRLERSHEVVLGDDSVLDEPAWQSGQRTLGCSSGHEIRYLRL